MYGTPFVLEYSSTIPLAPFLARKAGFTLHPGTRLSSSAALFHLSRLWVNPDASGLLRDTLKLPVPRIGTLSVFQLPLVDRADSCVYFG
jgi:hypothetical protein